MTTPSPDSSANHDKATARNQAEEAKTASRTIREDEVTSSDIHAEPTLSATETVEATNETSESPVPVQRAYGYWLLLMFVVFAGSLASLAWYGWNLFQSNSARINHVLVTQKADQNVLDQALQAARSQLAQLSTATSTAQQQREQMQTENQSAQKKLTQRIDNLDRHYAQIEDRLGRGELAWQVAEIGFLLTRAEERLSIAHDPAGAAVALTLADQRLATLSRPEALPVRSAISEALMQLQKVDAFDRVGMALTLRRSATEVSSWPLPGADIQERASTPIAAAPTESAPWYIRWPQAAWQPIGDWLVRQFSLTRSDQPVMASARASTDRETRLWLTAVREALLARDAHAVEAAIQQAEDWIKPHYNDQAPAVARTLKALEETRVFFATETLPDLAPIFKAWRTSGLMAATTSAPEPVVTETHP